MSMWNRLRCLCVMTVALLVAMPAMAAEEAKSPESAKTTTGLRGYYAIMAKELKLSPEQKEKLASAVAARGDALAKWDEANKAKLDELTEASKKAKETGDAEADKKVRAAAKELRDARTAISDGATNTLKEMLTAEQKDGFEAYNLYVGAMVKFAAAKLDKEQKAKAKELSIAAAKEVTPDIKPKALTAVKDALAAKISAEILTAEQREAMTKAAAERGKSKAKPEADDAGKKAE